MFGSAKIGSLFGVPLYLQYLHLGMLALFVWVFFPVFEQSMTRSQAIIAVMAFIIILESSLLAHEYAHVLVAKWLGYSTEYVMLIVLGAVAAIEEKYRSGSNQLLVAIAGPVMSVVAAGICLVILQSNLINQNIILATAFEYGFYINILIAVFNMIPAFPLDGGRVLVSLVWIVTKNFYLAMKLGSAIALLISLFGLYFGAIYGRFGIVIISVFVVMINLPLIFSSREKIEELDGSRIV